MLKINKLTVENLVEGCVTDNRRPCFSYSLESDKKNVTLQRAVLSVGEWRVETTNQIAVPYEGPVLKPFTEYTVNLEVRDNKGEIARESTTFETGRMGTGWIAKWITDGSYYFTEPKISPKTMTFRKKITCSKQIESAKMYVTALGIYELVLNGEKVGEDYFAPGFTSYKHQLQYQTYDVSEQLKASNELIAVVGGGWAVGLLHINVEIVYMQKGKHCFVNYAFYILMEQQRLWVQMKHGKLQKMAIIKIQSFIMEKSMMRPLT